MKTLRYTVCYILHILAIWTTKASHDINLCIEACWSQTCWNSNQADIRKYVIYVALKVLWVWKNFNSSELDLLKVKLLHFFKKISTAKLYKDNCKWSNNSKPPVCVHSSLKTWMLYKENKEYLLALERESLFCHVPNPEIMPTQQTQQQSLRQKHSEWSVWTCLHSLFIYCWVGFIYA